MELEDLDVRAQVPGDVVHSSARRQQRSALSLDEKLKHLMRRCEELRQDRDSLLAKYNRIAEDKDRLRRETQRLIDRSKKIPELQEQLNVARIELDEMMNDRDSHRLKARKAEANCDGMRKLVEEKRAEAKKMKTQSKSVARLQNKLDSERQQHADIVKDRDKFGEIAQREEAYKNAIKIQKHAVKFEIEDLRSKIQETDQLEEKIHVSQLQYDNSKREGKILKSRVKWMTADRRALMQDKDALKAEADLIPDQELRIAHLERKLDAEKKRSEGIRRENKGLILKLQRAAAYGDAVREERQALQREKEQLRGQCRNCALLGKELNAKTRHCTFLENEKKTLELDSKRAAAEVDSLRKDVETMRVRTGRRRPGRQDGGANALELETL
jgi:DNA repair exonuclease SbcCD ATPase subunit